MIYFDNAATTWPKPPSVIRAVCDSMEHLSANPGRSGHTMAIKAGEKIFSVREQIAALFGVENPCNVIFTHNASHGLNIVIKGILSQGDHVICSQMDHNSVLRPVHSFGEAVSVSVAGADSEGYVDEEKIEKLIQDNTALIVMTHVSNVCGTIEPAARVAKIARKHNIPFLLDASQSAGILDIDMQRDCIDFLVFPGHKAMYGPMGTGVLCINCDYSLKPVMSGGTGSNSMELDQPDELPDRLECGTLNFPGICGLGEGIAFVRSLGTENIFKHEKKLTGFFLDEISKLKKYEVSGRKNTYGRSGVVSFVHKDYPSTHVSQVLNSSYNIATRAMFHCAYPSHLALGTSSHGAVRISFGMFNTMGEVKTLLYALEHI